MSLQQILSLKINSKLINFEFLVPDQLSGVSSINSEYVHPELSMWEWRKKAIINGADTTVHYGNG